MTVLLQCSELKHWYLLTSLHGTTTQKNNATASEILYTGIKELHVCNLLEEIKRSTFSIIGFNNKSTDAVRAIQNTVMKKKKFP
jgi:hypothetical protein